MRFFRVPKPRSLITATILLALLALVIFGGWNFYSGLEHSSLPGANWVASSLFNVHAVEAASLKLGNQVIEFPYTATSTTDTLLIRTNRSVYTGFNKAEIYFSVTSRNTAAESVSLQFLFPKGRAAADWVEERVDNSWQRLGLNSGPIPETAQLGPAFQNRQPVPGEYGATGWISFAITPGQTQYFHAQISFPPQSRGEFWLEAFGSAGGYGLLDPWYSSSWSYRKLITIPQSKVSGSTGFANFPVLVSLSGDGDLAAHALSTGNDILFTEGNGSTKINHERESYTSATGQLVAWVNVPFVNATSTTSFYMYFGNAAAADQQNKTGTWNTNYKGVWHLGETSGTSQADSTSNGNTLTKVSATSPTPTAGIIDGGQSFNGSTDSAYNTTAANLPASNSAMTMSIWFNISSCGSRTTVFETRWSSGNSATHMECIAGVYYVLNANDSNVIVSASYAPSNYGGPTIFWHQAVYTFDGTTPLLFLDGVQAASGVNATNSNTPDQLYVGGRSGFETLFSGKLDEARILNTNLSAAWIKTEYNNQSDPSTFLSIGPTNALTQTGVNPNAQVAARTGSAASWYNTSWTYRKKFSIDPVQVSGAQTNFPVFIKLVSDSDLAAQALSTGNDILFTDHRSNKIAYERELYTSTTGALLAWVNVPYVNSTSTTDIFMYFGNSGAADQQNKTGTWNSNYAAVWHLPNGTTLTANDSTSNANNGTINGATATGGYIDGAAFFPLSKTIDYGTGASLQTSTFTYSAWVNLNNVYSGVSAIFDSSLSGGPEFRADEVSCCYTWNLTLYVSGGGVQIGADNISIKMAVWTYVAVTYDSSGNYKFYVNGAPGVSGTNLQSFTFSNFLMSSLTTTYTFYNSLDEGRVSNVVRSAGWIKTEYNNQSNPSSFIGRGGLEVAVRAATTPTLKSRGGVKFR